MKRATLLSLILLTVLVSCEKSKTQEVNIEIFVDILFIDSDGANLISSEAGFDAGEIDIYYLRNGKRHLYYEGNLKYPKGFAIIENESGEKVFRLFLNSDVHTPVTHIQFGNNDIDMVRGEFGRSAGSVVCTKIWYNDNLVWSVEQPGPNGQRAFTIVK